MGLFKDIRGAMGGVDKKLLSTGTLARGRVIECDATAFSTGNTVASTEQVCKVTVEITGVPGLVPYQATCRFPIPVLYLTQMQTPGATVAVRVDPADPQNITLDLGTSPPPAHDVSETQTATDMASAQQLASGSEQADSAPENPRSDIKGPEILARGEACKVIIVDSVPLGQLDSQGLPATGFVLSVFVSGKAPYQVRIGVGVPAAGIPLVYPGANLPARVLPERPELVAIDWTAAIEAAKAGPPS